MDELRTKPDILLSVWADPNNGQVESLGSAKICLNKLATQKFTDRQFKD